MNFALLLRQRRLLFSSVEAPGFASISYFRARNDMTKNVQALAQLFGMVFSDCMILSLMSSAKQQCKPRRFLCLSTLMDIITTF